MGSKESIEDSLFIANIINDNLDNNKTCYNCKWNKEKICLVELTYMTEDIERELRTCEAWEFIG